MYLCRSSGEGATRCVLAVALGLCIGGLVSPDKGTASPSTQQLTRDGHTVMILVDGSERMRGQAASLRRDVVSRIGRLRAEDHFGIVIQNVMVMYAAPLPGRDSYKAEAERFVNHWLVPEKMKGDSAALARPLAIFKAWNVSDVYLYTDGHLGEIAAAAGEFRKENVSKSHIHTTLKYAADDGDAVRLLQRIAEESGGTAEKVEGR